MVKEGDKAFQGLIDFAGKVPFSLEEIQAGAGNLAVVTKNAEELNIIKNSVLSFVKIKTDEINSEILDYFVDTTPNKTNKYMPGTHIFVKNYKKRIRNLFRSAKYAAWSPWTEAGWKNMSKELKTQLLLENQLCQET